MKGLQRAVSANFAVALALTFELFSHINVLLPAGGWIALGMVLLIDQAIGNSSITSAHKKMGIRINRHDCVESVAVTPRVCNASAIRLINR
jgi:hypothetical protein